MLNVDRVPLVTYLTYLTQRSKANSRSQAPDAKRTDEQRDDPFQSRNVRRAQKSPILQPDGEIPGDAKQFIPCPVSLTLRNCNDTREWCGTGRANGFRLYLRRVGLGTQSRGGGGGEGCAATVSSFLAPFDFDLPSRPLAAFFPLAPRGHRVRYRQGGKEAAELHPRGNAPPVRDGGKAR